MSRAMVVREAELSEGPSAPGISRYTAFGADDRWIGRAIADAGVVSDWHHHGRHDTYFYVLSGAARINLAGGESLEVRAGDFAHIPAGIVHREGPLGDRPLDAVVIRLGSGPSVFDVPDPGAG